MHDPFNVAFYFTRNLDQPDKALRFLIVKDIYRWYILLTPPFLGLTCPCDSVSPPVVLLCWRKHPSFLPLVTSEFKYARLNLLWFCCTGDEHYREIRMVVVISFVKFKTLIAYPVEGGDALQLYYRTLRANIICKNI